MIESINKSIQFRNSSDDNNTTDTDIQLMIDQEFLYVVNKHGLLAPISICSSSVLLIIGVLLAFINDPSQWHPYAAVWYTLDCFISCSCNYLLFGFSKTSYDIICGRLHRFCETCKLQKLKNRIQKQDYHDTKYTIENVESNSIHM